LLNPNFFIFDVDMEFTAMHSRLVDPPDVTDLVAISGKVFNKMHFDLPVDGNLIFIALNKLTYTGTIKC